MKMARSALLALCLGIGFIIVEGTDTKPITDLIEKLEKTADAGAKPWTNAKRDSRVLEALKLTTEDVLSGEAGPRETQLVTEMVAILSSSDLKKDRVAGFEKIQTEMRKEVAEVVAKLETAGGNDELVADMKMLQDRGLIVSAITYYDLMPRLHKAAHYIDLANGL